MQKPDPADEVKAVGAILAITAAVCYMLVVIFWRG